MEDLGIEAKEAVVREVAKILPLPDFLASIASIKFDYLSRQQVEQVLIDYSGANGEEKNPETAFLNKKSALLQLTENTPVPKTIIFSNKEYLMESQNDDEMVRVLTTVERLRVKVFELGKSPIMVSNYCNVFIKIVKKIRRGKLKLITCTTLRRA